MKKHSVRLISILLVFSFFIASCASIVGKSEYPITISSDPEEVTITVVNRSGETVFKGKTPTTVTLPAKAGFFKGENYTVTFLKEGFASHTAQIERGVSGWYILGNLVFGGLIGWFIVDPATGAMWTLKNLHANLMDQTSSIEKEQIHILTLNEVPEDLRKHLVRIN